MAEAEIITALLDANTRLTEQIVELSRALAETRAPQFLPPWQSDSAQVEQVRGPMWIPENEEDALHAFNSGLIDKEGLETALKEIGFYNAEITVPSPI